MILKEIKTLPYWLHIAIIGTTTLFILQHLLGGKIFSFYNILLSIPIIGGADVLAELVTGVGK